MQVHDAHASLKGASVTIRHDARREREAQRNNLGRIRSVDGTLRIADPSKPFENARTPGSQWSPRCRGVLSSSDARLLSTNLRQREPQGMILVEVW